MSTSHTRLGLLISVAILASMLPLCTSRCGACSFKCPGCCLGCPSPLTCTIQKAACIAVGSACSGACGATGNPACIFTCQVAQAECMNRVCPDGGPIIEPPSEPAPSVNANIRTLTALQPLCTKYTLDIYCTSAAHRFCEAIFGDQRAGWLLHIDGINVGDEGVATVVCVKTNYDDLPDSKIPGCDSTSVQALNSFDCFAQTQNWCRANSRGNAGFVQEADGGNRKIGTYCFNTNPQENIIVKKADVQGACLQGNHYLYPCFKLLSQICKARTGGASNVGIISQVGVGDVGVACTSGDIVEA